MSRIRSEAMAQAFLFVFPTFVSMLVPRHPMMRLHIAGLCVLLSTGCGRMLVGLAGMHAFDHDVTPAKADRLAQRMKIPAEEDLVLSQRYSHHLEAMRGTMKEKTFSVMYQPLQLRWYSKGGRAQWIIPNCDVGGYPNLQWSRFGLPDTLFANLHCRSYADSAWTLADDLRFMTSRTTGEAPVLRQDVDGYLLVYWSYFMGRQSVRLARHIHKWQENQGRAVEVRFVNVDSLMMGVDKPEVE